MFLPRARRLTLGLALTAAPQLLWRGTLRAGTLTSPSYFGSNSLAISEDIYEDTRTSPER